jgi:hypothetical protein
MTECIVCIEKFNKSTRKPVTCPYCSTSICRTCIQTCLLQENTPKCQAPECKKAWSDEFLSTSLTKVWIDGPYLAHREKILLDQEKARLPETQEQAAIYINAKAIVDAVQPRIDALTQQLNMLPSVLQRNELFKQVYDYKLTRLERDAALEDYTVLEDTAKKDAKPLRKQINALKSDAYKTAKKYVESVGRDPTTSQRPAEEKKWTFVGKCPKSDCMGFVGMDYSCGLCKVSVCKDCMEGKEDGEHACNSDNVLNVRALRKEAKPCPKCAAMISKIDGCDQMWCTQCHTAFSWRTGAEETTVHNPHFYEWMRRTGQHMAPGAVQVGGQACQFTLVLATFQNAIRTAFPGSANNWYRANFTKPPAWQDKLYIINQGTSHANNWNLQTLNARIRDEEAKNGEEKRVLRVRFLAKEISEAVWKKPLGFMERISKRNHALRDIYDMFIQAAMSVMEQFSNAITELERTEWERRPLANSATLRSEAVTAASEATVRQYTELATYVNEELRKIKNRFTTTVNFITLPNAT